MYFFSGALGAFFGVEAGAEEAVAVAAAGMIGVSEGNGEVVVDQSLHEKRKRPGGTGMRLMIDQIYAKSKFLNQCLFDEGGELLLAGGKGKVLAS